MSNRHEQAAAPRDDEELPATLHAWVDESMRLTPRGPGTYILAAAVCDASSVPATQAGLRSLLLRGQTRLHWHDERDARRDAIVAHIASLDMTGVVVVGSTVIPAKQERARRKCMEVLLPLLGEMGVCHVLLESRTPTLNRDDNQMVRALRGKQQLPRGLRVDMARPTDDPMLWIPDTMAGAVNAARNDQGRWQQELLSTVEVIEINLS